jgi:hypothetical protein
MNEKITLNDGTEFAGYVILTGDLFLYLFSTDIVTAFNALIRTEGTSSIIYTQANGNEVTYSGYTKLVAVRDEENNLITAVMRKGV